MSVSKLVIEIVGVGAVSQMPYSAGVCGWRETTDIFFLGALLG